MRWLPLVVLACTVLLAACSAGDEPRLERAKRAATATGDIVIGAVWPWQGDKGDLWEGIELAVDEINGSGGVLGRQIRIVKEDDEGSLVKGRLIAQKFAENTDMIAVIGHRYSYIALPASAIYQNAQLVFLTPGATSYQINHRGNDMVFRSIPSNRNLGSRMADYMAARGYRRVAIYYVKDKNSQDMANFFEQRAHDLNLAIVDRRSYMQGTRDFRSAIQHWKDLYQFDALFLAGYVPEASHFIAQARAMGLTMPIVGGDGLDTRRLINMAGSAAEGVAIPDIYPRDENWPPYRHFDEIYARKHHRPSHSYPALGYDSVHLLVQAIRQANSSVPAEIAKALRTTHRWPGATGAFSFDANGDIPEKRIGVKAVRGGRFDSVE